MTRQMPESILTKPGSYYTLAEVQLYVWSTNNASERDTRNGECILVLHLDRGVVRTSTAIHLKKRELPVIINTKLQTYGSDYA